MMGAPNLIADTMDCGLSYSVISHLKKLSQQVKRKDSTISSHRLELFAPIIVLSIKKRTFSRE